jgi:hypothetical protein
LLEAIAIARQETIDDKKTIWLAALLGPIVASPLFAATSYMSGNVSLTRLQVDAGDMVIATADLTVTCDEDAVIAGSILGDPGVKVEIVAATEIHVTGTVRAGNGANGSNSDRAGRNGGDVILSASSICIDGATIRAGAGGNGAPGAGRGGDGGDIVFDCDALYVSGSHTVRTGDGGGSRRGNLRQRSSLGCRRGWRCRW